MIKCIGRKKKKWYLFCDGCETRYNYGYFGNEKDAIEGHASFPPIEAGTHWGKIESKLYCPDCRAKYYRATQGTTMNAKIRNILHKHFVDFSLRGNKKDLADDITHDIANLMQAEIYLKYKKEE